MKVKNRLLDERFPLYCLIIMIIVLIPLIYIQYAEAQGAGYGGTGSGSVGGAMSGLIGGMGALGLMSGLAGVGGLGIDASMGMLPSLGAISVLNPMGMYMPNTAGVVPGTGGMMSGGGVLPGMGGMMSVSNLFPGMGGLIPGAGRIVYSPYSMMIFPPLMLPSFFPYANMPSVNYNLNLFNMINTNLPPNISGGIPFYYSLGAGFNDSVGNILGSIYYTRFMSGDIDTGISPLSPYGIYSGSALFPVFSGHPYYYYISTPDGFIHGVPVANFATAIYGMVYDKDGNPLEGVTVAISTGTKKCSSEQDGFYTMLIMSGVQVPLKFTKDNYESKEILVDIGYGIVQKIQPIYLTSKDKPKPQNSPPVIVLPDMPVKTRIGKEIRLADYVSVNDDDPDDEHQFLFFELRDGILTALGEDGAYTPKEEDLGQHWFRIKVTDSANNEDIKDLLIIVLTGYDMDLSIGFNLIGYPFEEGNTDFTAFDLLRRLGDANHIYSIESYSYENDSYLRAYYNSNGMIDGNDFSINIGEGYIVYSKLSQKITVTNGYTRESETYTLEKGINLIGIASYPDGYSSYDLMWDLTFDYINSIYCFDAKKGEWKSTYWVNYSPAGDDFPIQIGVGYKIIMKMDKDFGISHQKFFLSLL